jgi:hypothetical protein
MRLHKSPFLASLASLLLALTACTETPPPDLDCPTEGRYMELSPGASWSYRVGKRGDKDKTQTVGPLEEVADKRGTMAYRLTTSKSGGETVSWQEDTGQAILRHREHDRAGDVHRDKLYTPFKLRIDDAPERTVVGATWSEAYTQLVTGDDGSTRQLDQVEAWEVEAVDEVIGVPAGHFCTLRVRRTTTAGDGTGSTKTFWFARGVGKVREAGTGERTEELVSYTR